GGVLRQSCGVPSLRSVDSGSEIDIDSGAFLVASPTAITLRGLFCEVGPYCLLDRVGPVHLPVRRSWRYFDPTFLALDGWLWHQCHSFRLTTLLVLSC